MSQPVGIDPNTASFEEIEQYLAQTDPQQADAAAANPEPTEEETDYADIQVEAPAPAPAEPVQAEQPKMYSHEEHEAALNRKAKEVRESITKSEEYLLYKDMVARRAKADNISQKEAVKRIRDEMFESEKERLSKDPKALAEAVLRSQMFPEPTEPETPEPAPQETAEDRVRALAEAVRGSMQNGRLPADFDVNKCLEIYPEFFDDAKSFGEAAAVRIAEERYRAAALERERQRVVAQNSVPQSIAPSSQPAPVPRGISDMSDAEFAKLERQVDRYTNAGIHVRI